LAASTSPVAATSAPVLASSPPPPIPAPVTLLISAVGDCTLGGDVHRASELSPFDAVIAAHDGDLRYPFSGVRALLESDDVTIANLEGTLTTSHEPDEEVSFHFRGRPGYAEILREGSVEVVNL